jgi:hypothetical protein
MGSCNGGHHRTHPPQVESRRVPSPIATGPRQPRARSRERPHGLKPRLAPPPDPTLRAAGLYLRASDPQLARSLSANDAARR